MSERSGPGGREVRRPLLEDVAAEAGVSLATVDRVLNRRPGVREITARRVLQAAAALGYLPEDDLFPLLQPRPMKLAFLLPAGSNQYLRLLGDLVRNHAERTGTTDARLRCAFIEGFNPRALADALRRFGDKSDGVAFMALDHPLVREAVNRLLDQGKQVVTVISDLSNSRRAAYVGLDNRAAGRTAAYLLSRFSRRQEGSIALIAGSRSYRAHEEREMGFLSLVEEALPACHVVGVREGHDEPDENHRHTRMLLASHPDLIGIYNVGGSSDGIARALRETGQTDKVVVIGHGLTPSARPLLMEGAVDAILNQSPEALIETTLKVFRNARAGRQPLQGVPPLSLEIVLRENLP